MAGLPIILQGARLKLAKQRPYLSAALWALIPVAKPGLANECPGPIGVDKYWRMYYDPEKIESWDIDAATSVLYHEIGHLIRGHALRGEPLPAMIVTPTGPYPLFSIAGDLEINDDIEKEGFKFPDGLGIFPKTFKLPDDLIAEEYYELLLKKNPPMKIEVNCGSCASGHKQPWEDGEPAGEGTESKDGQGQTPGVSEAIGELIRRQVARDVVDASKTQGNVPAGLLRWAQNKLDPTIDWRRRLATVVRNAVREVLGQTDYTNRRFSRRQHALGNVRLPALMTPQFKVGIVVDTSGSIGQEELDKELAEIQGILKCAGVGDVTTFVGDTDFVRTDKVQKAKDIKVQGGGGTDMTRGLHMAFALRPRPEVVVLLTDGYTAWPVERPPCKVVVALVPGGTPDRIPGWYETVQIQG